MMALCGEQGIRRMVAGFYRRVRTDDLIGPMYPDDDWEGSEERLAEFVLFRMGASTRYTEMRGHPRLKARHMPFRIRMAERDRWLELMNAAIDEAGFPDPARDFLRSMFFQIADFMRNHPEAGAGGDFRLSPLPEPPARG